MRIRNAHEKERGQRDGEIGLGQGGNLGDGNRQKGTAHKRAKGGGLGEVGWWASSNYLINSKHSHKVNEARKYETSSQNRSAIPRDMFWPLCKIQTLWKTSGDETLFLMENDSNFANVLWWIGGILCGASFSKEQKSFRINLWSLAIARCGDLCPKTIHGPREHFRNHHCHSYLFPQCP